MSVGLLFLSAGVMLGHKYRHATRPYESSAFADVIWAEGGKPMIVQVSVRDSAGLPVSNVDVYVDNNSGGNSSATNAKGVAVLSMGESDFAGLAIDGAWVVSRPHAYQLGSPSVENGLKVDVELK